MLSHNKNKTMPDGQQIEPLEMRQLNLDQEAEALSNGNHSVADVELQAFENHASNSQKSTFRQHRHTIKIPTNNVAPSIHTNVRDDDISFDDHNSDDEADIPNTLGNEEEEAVT